MLRISGKLFFLIALAFIQTCLLIYFISNIRTHYPFYPNPHVKPQPTTHISEIAQVKIDKFTSTSDFVSLEFTLFKHGQPNSGNFPRAALEFSYDTKKLFNISDYETINIELSSIPANTLDLTIRADILDYSNEDDFSTFLHYKYEIPVWKDRGLYSIKIEDLQIPGWWYKDNSLSKYDALAKRDFTRIRDIIIGNDTSHPFSRPSSFTINKIEFSGINRTYLLISAGIIIINCCGLILFCLLRRYTQEKRKNAYNRVISYKTIDLDEPEQKNRENLFQFLDSNYTNSMMSIELAHDNTHISKKKIPRIIKDETGLTFPQYIHQLRLDHAKRLLCDTDTKIIDIAYEVGYNSINNFNLFFKRYEKRSPLQYRKGVQDTNAEKL